ncbi:MAG: 5-formyltetrahydrofolate cyclo-ligase [Gammaproteobacteria bacterium]|jgi:5,10-methenyltetrahydrofolate synthetase
MHEFDASEPATSNVKAWRRAERSAQLERRLTLTVEQRRDNSASITRNVSEAIGEMTGICVSLYWPIRGEPDTRKLLDEITRSGGRCALPVVVERGRPLEFREWRPGDRLTRGIWNIPVPSDGANVVPDVIIAPVVAFDRACYRLGYGGGYFDRTLSLISGEALVLGVGYAMAEIQTIRPQSHDIPMDAIVTENDVLKPNRCA